MSETFAVRETEGKGKGLFALTAIEQGAHILDFKGEVVNIDLSQVDPEQITSSLQVSCELCLCDSGFEDDYVNHSCNPTGFILMSGSFAAGQDVQAGQVALFATRDIEPGEEITFDYSLNVCASTWKMHIECCCGSTSCRGSILPITELDPAYLAQCAKKRQLSDHMLGHMESLIESLGTQ